jgi:hypothetical protein
VPYGYGPAPRSLSGISIAACILLGIAALVCLGSAGTLFSRADAAAAAADGDFGAFRALPQRDDSVAIGTGLYVLSMLVAGPLVIVWQHRHASNAQRLSGPLGLGPGWAIGGWFVPLGNLVLPTVQLAQAGRASDPDLVPGPPGARSRGRIPPITIVWGVAWALGGVLFSVGATMRPTEDDTPVLSAGATLEDFAAADRTAGVGMLVLAVAAVLAIVMVRTLTSRQARAEAVRPPFAGTAGPWAGGQPGAWADQATWAAPTNPWAPPPAPGGQPAHLAPPPPPPPPSGPGGSPPPPPPPPSGPPPDAWGPPR